MTTDAAGDFAGICSSLAGGAHSVRFRGFNALDRYFGLPALPFLWIETSADMAVLARFIDGLRYPGVQIADCAADTPDGTCYFRCPDRDEKSKHSFPLLSFSYDWQARRFLDPLGVYPMLRDLRERKSFLMDGDASVGWYRLMMDGALLLARYSFGLGTSLIDFTEFAKPQDDGSAGPPPGAEMQRVFLGCLLVSPRPDLGLDFLKRSGFIDEIWPELACLNDVDHSKEFHPEGNVWNHTLETFRHRKAGTNGAYDLRLSLGLLLHDTGKPISAAYGTRRFNGHAELGATAASRFLERLEFEPSLVSDVYYLVKNHMLPAALKRLPVNKTAEIMASPLFPTLMELYRCDESSSFKGLDGYYENSAAYQTYLKNVRNPYRSMDGKKIGKYKMHH